MKEKRWAGCIMEEEHNTMMIHQIYWPLILYLGICLSFSNLTLCNVSNFQYYTIECDNLLVAQSTVTKYIHTTEDGAAIVGNGNGHARHVVDSDAEQFLAAGQVPHTDVLV